MRIGLVELRIIVVVHTSKIDNIAHMIAELRSGFPIRRQLLHHFLSDIVLKLPVLDATRIAQHMEHHFSRMFNIFGNRRKIIRQYVVVGRQSEWTRERLKAGVAVADRI
jgi:hypothetical protein